MRPYNPSDPTAGLPKECVNCTTQPATAYTADGPMFVLCDTCKAELPNVPLMAVRYQPSIPTFHSDRLGRVTIPEE